MHKLRSLFQIKYICNHIIAAINHKIAYLKIRSNELFKYLLRTSYTQITPPQENKDFFLMGYSKQKSLKFSY